MPFLAVLFALALAAPLPASAQTDDAKAVTWLDFDFPPFYIHEGAAKGQGMGDRIVELLIAGLPDLRHDRQTASPTRILRELELGRQVCSVAYLKTPERERVMTFSVPDLILPPNGVTVRRDSLSRFGGGGAVSLATLLRDPTLRLGIADGRSYGDAIDPLLQARRGAPNLHVRQGEDLYPSLVQMLVRGRLDYVLGYPYEARYVADRFALGDSIVNLPLVEATGYTFAYVVCPKTDWGRALIGRVDELLRRERPSERYRAFIERWLDPGMLDAFRAAYRDQLLGAER